MSHIHEVPEEEIPEEGIANQLKRTEEVDVVVCSASIAFLKVLEKYVLYLELLRPLAPEIFFGITYVFDLYVS